MDYVPKYILVHHSAAEAPTPQFDAINEWHRVRGFVPSQSGYFVGYHRVIEKDGTVKVARADTERDCDALGHNFDSLSVCLVGNFDQVEPTDAQIDSLGKILNEWTVKYNISASKIWPHRHFANKSCYGSRLENSWAQIVCLSYTPPEEKATLSSLLSAFATATVKALKKPDA